MPGAIFTSVVQTNTKTSGASAAVFDHPSCNGHEQVLYCHDPDVGLRAIIAIHNTALGPAAGGCRMMPYTSADDALTDVLRLSEGMTLKNAMAGLPLGGGKCVIIADQNDPAKPELLRAFSGHVQHLGGRFWTAIDVGVGPADAEILAEGCDYIFANSSRYEPGFNPATYTALGGFVSIRAAAEHRWGTPDLSGRRVAIQGLGAAGSGLAAHLHQAGASLVVADIQSDAVDRAVAEYGAVAVDPAAIHAQDVDIFAPCALGAVLNDTTIPQLQAEVVCGLANNQLAEARHGQQLRDAAITYVPDYIANAGGISAAGAVIYSEPTDEDIRHRIEDMRDTVLEVLDTAEAQARPTSAVADDIARSRVAAGRS